MLTEAELDIVHVCTPHDLHEGQAITAMEAGCHVLLEKPIATTAEEGIVWRPSPSARGAS